MDTGDPVVSMSLPANYGSGGKGVPKFICSVDVPHHKIHEFWTYREDGVTCKVHPTARVDFSARFVGKFAMDYLTSTWRRVPMFGRNYITGSVEWIGITNFLKYDGPPWNLNLLSPYYIWGYRGSSTSPNWGSGSGGNSGSTSIPWN